MALGGALLVWLALQVAPSFAGRPGFTAPLSWKLFFFHVPVAMMGFLGLGLASLFSLLYLARNKPNHDRHALAAAETGLVFAALTLITGMIWGKAEWGEPWRWWDTKLVLVLVMFLVYSAYLVLRAEIENPETRARIAAIYALLGAVTLPLAYFAQRIWLSAHPIVFGNEQPDAGIVTPGVTPIFIFAFTVFLATYALLHRWRIRTLDLAAQLETLQNQAEAPE